MPLTTSLYVPGTLADPDNVIVDVGTGFYVEKVCTYTSVYHKSVRLLIDIEHERCHKVLHG